VKIFKTSLFTLDMLARLWRVGLERTFLWRWLNLGGRICLRISDSFYIYWLLGRPPKLAPTVRLPIQDTVRTVRTVEPFRLQSVIYYYYSFLLNVLFGSRRRNCLSTRENNSREFMGGKNVCPAVLTTSQGKPKLQKATLQTPSSSCKNFPSVAAWIIASFWGR
jgi:hypothetical protein